MLLLKIVSPIIFIIGIFGNLISFCIFRSEKMKHLPTFRFLSYLSMIDCLYILIGIPHIISITFFNYDFRNTSNFMCSIHSFFTIYLSHLSSNVLAIIGVFRSYEITSHNNISKKNGLLNKKIKDHTNKNVNWSYSSNHLTFCERLSSSFGKAEQIFLAILILLFLCDSHFLLMMRLTEQIYSNNNETNILYSNKTNLTICHPSPEDENFYYEFYIVIWPWIDMVLYSYMPFLIMVTSTCIIISKLFKANKNLNDKSRSYYQNYEKSKSINLQSVNENSEINVNADELSVGFKQKRNELIYEEMKRRTKRNNQVYKLLISLNVLFFILVTPLVLCNSLKVLKIENEFILEFVYILAYLNHCLNFVFYSLSCEMYRVILLTYFRKIFKAFNVDTLNNNNDEKNSNIIY